MANIKFSAFTQKVDQANVDFLVGYTGTDNVRIAPSTIGQGVYVLKAGDTMTGALQMGASFSAQIPINFGDANFQISTENNYTAANLDNLKFKVPDAASGGFRFTNANDDEIFFAQGDGKIGVNTVTPQSTLDVNLGGNSGIGASFAGTISSGEYQGIHFGYSEKLNDNYKKSAIVFERDDSSGSATANAQGNIYILNNINNNSGSATLADQRMKISKNTNVGIGEDLRPQYPEAKLTVNSDPGNTSQPDRITTSVVDSHTGLFLNGTGNAINEKYGLQFGWYSGYSTGGIFVVGDNVAGSTSGDMTFDMGNGTSAGALVERMRLTHEGDLGIGTDAPSANLHVKSSGNGEVNIERASGALINLQAQSALGVIGTNSNHNLSFKTNSNVGLTLTTGGNVGISTTNPTTKLEINADDDGTTDLNLLNLKRTWINPGTNDRAHGILFSDLNSSMATIYADRTNSATNFNSDLLFATNTGANGTDVSTKMIIKNTGNVGINKTNPQAKLDVVGRIGLNDGNQNVLVGDNAGDALTTGGDNVALGYNALSTENTGSRNTALGRGTLQNLDYNGNGYNTAVGYEAGNDVISGLHNTLIGALSGDALTLGSDNVAVGLGSLSKETEHGKNVAVGRSALETLEAGADGFNTAVGYQAGLSATTGLNGVYIGANAGVTLQDGANNVAIGRSALGSAVSDSNNTAIGYAALSSQNGAGTSYNVAIGHQAGTSVSIGTNNTLIGGLAADALTEGFANVSIGYQSLGSATIANNNVAIGVDALATNVAADRNVAIGSEALEFMTAASTTDTYNVAVGYNAGKFITDGVSNTILGGQAGDALTSGSYSVAIGHLALGNETTAGGNVAVGYKCLFDSLGGTNNTSLGFQSGENLTTGDNNTFLGMKAGDAITTGSSNVIIGPEAAASAVDVSNEVSIFNGSVTARFQGSASSWSFVSDARDKKDIKDLELGVEFINKLKPRKFKWDLRDSDVDKEKQASGFVAQEIQEVLDNENIDYSGIVDTNNPDQYTVAQASIIPMLVKAVQELSAKVKELENK